MPCYNSFNTDSFPALRNCKQRLSGKVYDGKKTKVGSCKEYDLEKVYDHLSDSIRSHLNEALKSDQLV